MARSTLTLLTSMLSVKTEQIGWSTLSKAWSKQLNIASQGHNNSRAGPTVISSAVERTLPLLVDGGATSVPFVCRYRTDVIAPLEVSHIHQLADWLMKHQTLESTREKLLQHESISNDRDLLFRVQTSYSKAELDDLYAPFKPPSKGSLEDRIRQEHPALVEAVNRFFYEGNGRPNALQPRDAAVTLLANRIASHPLVMDGLLDSLTRNCRVKVEQGKDDDSKYKVYYDMDRPVVHLRDYQVLAMRRGSDKKALKITFVVDTDHAESIIQRALYDKSPRHGLWKDSIHDAWTRLLRKRFTTRVWRDKLSQAQSRSVSVFCDNLRKALLAPPPKDPRPLLSLDPGFRAGIKCALLSADGSVQGGDEGFSTVGFVPNKEKGRRDLIDLLQKLRRMDSSSEAVLVIVGNGHGTQEAQQLLREASTESGIQVDVKLVNEAGASVWSVEPSAKLEFPNQAPASVAAVSIGRRYLNPLAELVKIPPRSLGLGMYQHDVPEKELDEQLHLTSIDAVAEVGVDVNSGSLEIISKIPGLNMKLAERILKNRPIASRQALLKVSGLGPKTFENCAAFLRVDRSKEPLDATLCHPESYELARYLLKKMKLNLSDPSGFSTLPGPKERPIVWKEMLEKASDKFDVTEERVLMVMDHLIRSVLNPDPRRVDDNASQQMGLDFEENDAKYKALPADLVATDVLRKQCPVRDVKAVVRNVLDFGIFADFGGDSDGLIHRSKLGPKSLDDFLIGQSIGVDILGVSKNKRVSLSLAGLGLPAESLDDHKRQTPSVSCDTKKRRTVQRELGKKRQRSNA